MASSVMEEQKIGNVSIIQHATDPTEPTGLSKTRLLALGLLFALMAATAWIGVADFFDANIHTAGDVEKHLGQPPLEVVPMLKDRYWFGLWKSYQRSEAFRKIAWALANSLPNGMRVVHFTSASRREGVTTAVLATAEHLTHSQKLRLLVIELDQHAPTYLARFGIHSDRSLNSFTPDKDLASCIYTAENGVAIAAIQSDQIRSHVDPERLAEFLKEARRNYDLVLLDGPPLSDPDAGPISVLSDAVVLVIASGHTSFKILERARQELTAKHVPIMGTILNKQKSYIPSWV
jgi:Mrp family chromosome partitioning ATPase